MIWCGIEEPLVANSQIYSLNEQTGAIQCAEFGISGLHRYSFTKIMYSQWQKFVACISEQIGNENQWAIVWEHHESGDFKMRSLVRLSALRRKGFNVRIEAGVGLATCLFESCEPGQFQPPGFPLHPAGDGATLLLAGETDPGAALVARIDSPTIREASVNYLLRPSREFLSWLAGTQLRIVYVSRDHVERPGLVLLTQQRMDLSRLLENGLIDRVEEGADAAKVWL